MEFFLFLSELTDDIFSLVYQLITIQEPTQAARVTVKGEEHTKAASFTTDMEETEDVSVIALLAFSRSF